MEKLTKKYWKGFEELYNTPEYQESKQREFAEDLPVEALMDEVNKNTVTPRRDFLKMIGFGVGTATLAACNRIPVHKSVPYLVRRSEEHTSELQSLMRSSYAVFCLKKKKLHQTNTQKPTRY